MSFLHGMAGFWGKKNLEKCSLCLIMFRSNWTEISWNVLISAGTLGCSVRTKETIANAAEHPKHRVIREFGVLLAVWFFCRPFSSTGRKLWTENASLLQKAPMASPDLRRRTGKKWRILATYLSPIRMLWSEIGWKKVGFLRENCEIWRAKALFHRPG